MIFENLAYNILQDGRKWNQNFFLRIDSTEQFLNPTNQSNLQN